MARILELYYNRFTNSDETYIPKCPVNADWHPELYVVSHKVTNFNPSSVVYKPFETHVLFDVHPKSKLWRPREIDIATDIEVGGNETRLYFTGGAGKLSNHDRLMEIDALCDRHVDMTNRLFKLPESQETN